MELWLHSSLEATRHLPGSSCLSARMGITLALWRGLGALFADIAPPAPALLLRLARYALLGLQVSYGAPLLFRRLRWMTALVPRAAG